MGSNATDLERIMLSPEVAPASLYRVGYVTPKKIRSKSTLPTRSKNASACPWFNKTSYSAPIRAPFSATERRIGGTTNTSAKLTTAKTEKTSK